MSNKPRLRKLDDKSRRETIDLFLTELDAQPELAHFRTLLRTPAERELALFAAWERVVLLGTPAAAPPRHDDPADQLLCDLLDCVDRHPELKRHGSYYGPDRPLANLQAMGLWRGNQPLERPTAIELFTTAFAKLTAEAASGLPPSTTNFSPAGQVFGSNGELIGPPAAQSDVGADGTDSPHDVEATLVMAIGPDQPSVQVDGDASGIIHHAAPKPGEQFGPGASEQLQPPLRPVRRGRPLALDDVGKGRLLGLMSFGLSFRQAAAQLGVHHVTLLNTMKRDEEFAQQVAEARLDAISQPLLTVVQAARTNWRAAAWLARFLTDRRASAYETTPEERALDHLRQR